VSTTNRISTRTSRQHVGAAPPSSPLATQAPAQAVAHLSNPGAEDRRLIWSAAPLGSWNGQVGAFSEQVLARSEWRALRSGVLVSALNGKAQYGDPLAADACRTAG